jgi:VPDSG-CTERM motif
MRMKTNAVSTRKLVLLVMVGCAVTLASTNDAKATPLPMPKLNLAIGDGHGMGQVYPAIAEGDADITQYVNYMIGLSLGGSGHVIIGPHDNMVTRSKNNFGLLPSPAVLATRGTGLTIDLRTHDTYDYLFAHYGGPGGGFAEVWYVADLSGTTTLPASALGHGLSGWALFTGPNGSVPDSGATVMLLGAALAALGVVRRFLG